jgi:hypothetical protein
VLADSDTFGTSPEHAEGGTADGGVCCGGTAADAEKATATNGCC